MRYTGLLLACALAFGGTGAAQAAVMSAGSSGQFVFDTNTAVTGVTLLSDPATYDTGEHFYPPFMGLGNSIGDLADGVDDGENLYLNMGEPRPWYAPSAIAMTFGAPIANGPGVDLYIFESGYHNNPDAMAVSLNGANFWYEAPADFAYVFDGHDGVAPVQVGYWTYGYDLSDMGVAEGAAISNLVVRNFHQFATVVGGDGTGYNGWVDYTASAGVLIEGGNGGRYGGQPAPPNANSYYFTSILGPLLSAADTDPDPFYAAGVGVSVIPEPGTLAVLGLGLLAGLRRRRS